MEKFKMIINHPLSKAISFGIAGSILLLEGHSLYSGICIGYAIREVLLAFKAE